MKIHIQPDANSLALEAAAFIAEQARLAIDARGRFSLALSGGTGPHRMFEALAQEDVPWKFVHVFQVDERATTAESPERNFRAIRDLLLDHIAIPDNQVHPMPVELDDLNATAKQYAATLHQSLGSAMTFDLVHLGLGEDGHTASMLTGDPALASTDDVAVSREYQGFRRLSLTLPVISRARQRLWLVTGARKSKMLKAAVEGDASIPAGRVNRNRTVFFVDTAAAAMLDNECNPATDTD